MNCLFPSASPAALPRAHSTSPLSKPKYQKLSPVLARHVPLFGSSSASVTELAKLSTTAWTLEHTVAFKTALRKTIRDENLVPRDKQKFVLSVKRNCSKELYLAYLKFADRRFDQSRLRAALGNKVCTLCKDRFTDGRNESPICSECFKTEEGKQASHKWKGAKVAATWHARSAESKAEILKARETTCLERYRETNPSKVPEIIERIAKAFEKKHGKGVRNAMHVGELRNKAASNRKESYSKNSEAILARARATSQENWGTDHHMQSVAGKKNHQAKIEEKHGVSNVMFIPEVKRKHKKSVQELAQTAAWKEAVRQGVLASKGVDNIFKHAPTVAKFRAERKAMFGSTGPLAVPGAKEKYKETSQINWGADHHMGNAIQSAIVFRKSRSGLGTSKPVALNGRQVKVFGYEPQVIAWLLAKGHKPDNIGVEADIPSIYYVDAANKPRQYYPDLRLLDKELDIEVKSTYTLLGSSNGGWSAWKTNVSKAKYAAKALRPLRWLVSDGKTKCCVLPKNWFEWSLADLVNYVQDKTNYS